MKKEFILLLLTLLFSINVTVEARNNFNYTTQFPRHPRMNNYVYGNYGYCPNSRYMPNRYQRGVITGYTPSILNRNYSVNTFPYSTASGQSFITRVKSYFNDKNDIYDPIYTNYDNGNYTTFFESNAKPSNIQQSNSGNYYNAMPETEGGVRVKIIDP